MIRRNERLTGVGVAVLAAGLVALQGCSSGSGGSEVGNREGVPPTARAQILNGAGSSTFREGAEVLLTGKDSEDGDGPVLGWTWKQTAGPTVALIERNTNTVSFTAPDVSAATMLKFELTVEDSSSDKASTSIDVNVLPAGQDSDKFLTLDVRGARKDTFDTFKVVAALAAGASTGTAPKPFTLSATAYLVYPPRLNANAECAIDIAPFAGTIPASTLSGCLVEPLADLTPTPAGAPAGTVGLPGEWPANIQVPSTGDETTRIGEYWNPRFELEIPRLDVAEFNQKFVDARERNKLLDQFNAHNARIVIKLSLTAPQNQNDATLIPTTAGGVPVSLPASVTPPPGAAAKIITNGGTGQPTVAVMSLDSVLASIVGRESAHTARVYYDTVDPTKTRTTLNAWLAQAGFLGPDGKLLPAAEAGTGEFAHAVYLNNYDLGFGRDMHARRDTNGNVYSFVVNYPTLEGAIREVAPIVTVVMEHSGLSPSDPNKFTKFFTYVDDGSGDSRRVGSMDFDGRGERFTPGNCVACHGGVKPPGARAMLTQCTDADDPVCYAWPQTNDDGVDVSNGNLRATFLPWDLDSVFFADTDPAITQAPLQFDGVTLAAELRRDFGDYSRAAQEAQLKKLNEFTLSTYCDDTLVRDCPTGAARRLVKYWYNDTDLSSNTLLASKFEDSTAPAGWLNNEVVPVSTTIDRSGFATNPANAEQIYQTVFAQNCRMCHTNAGDPAMRFDNYQKFRALFTQEVLEAVYKQGRMPAARLTADRFWTAGPGGSSAAQALAAHMNLPAADAAGPAPLAQVEIVAPAAATTARNVPVRLSASDSVLAKTFSWDLEYTPPSQLASAPGFAGYAPGVVGDGTPEVAFVPDKPGTYTARLAINAQGLTAPPSAQQDSETITVKDFVPLACDDTAATTPGAAALTIRFIELRDRVKEYGSAETCDTAGLPSIATSPDLPLTYTLTPAFDANGRLTTANGGQFTIVPGAPCTAAAPAGCIDDALTYLPRASGPTYFDSVSYTIMDADGQTSTAVVRVDVTEDLNATGSPPVNLLSDNAGNMTLTISGGALGSPRYRVTLSASNAPEKGTVTPVMNPPVGAMTPGSSFTTNSGSVSFVYQSDEFATGVENFALVVTDMAGGTPNSDTAPFVFSILPRAPFASTPVVGGQNRVMSQWTVDDGDKLDCTGCHLGGTAATYFDLTQTDLQVWQQLVNGTVGDVKVVAPALRESDPDSSLILCYPSLNCVNNNVSHNGGTEALPDDHDSYDVIRRWIQEGAQFN